MKCNMINKIMWKHLQQKPILNAMGMFAMNSRTIFKLLSSIMSYIIIMIQFNELDRKISTYGNGTIPVNS
ncbi:gustatory and pheromone receptor 39a-like [Haematobia irritans]|uniref:gustatory and pheromone receptor 39a-like n=1 Tax=Haematobia irritans TaxID=7368 RepID=UPI003F4F8EE4